jgi:uncharacterized membrane protein
MRRALLAGILALAALPAPSGAARRALPVDQAEAIAFTPDGSSLAVAYGNEDTQIALLRYQR